MRWSARRRPTSMSDDETPFWALADQVARLRGLGEAELSLVSEILAARWPPTPRRDAPVPATADRPCRSTPRSSRPGLSPLPPPIASPDAPACAASTGHGPGAAPAGRGSPSPSSTAAWRAATRGSATGSSRAWPSASTGGATPRSSRTSRSTCTATGRRAPASSWTSRPNVDIISVRVLNEDLKGKGAAFVEGLSWAIQRGVQVANLSLSLEERGPVPGLPRARRRSLLPQRHPGQCREQRERGLLSIAVQQRGIRCRSRRARSVAALLQPQPTGRVRGLGRGRPDRVEGRDRDGGHRQLVRRARTWPAWPP